MISAFAEKDLGLRATHCEKRALSPLDNFGHKIDIFGPASSRPYVKTTLIRSASLTQFPQLAQAHGLDVRDLLAQAGLPLACLTDTDFKVSVAAVSRVLELAAKQADEPAFGLRLAEDRRLSNLGPLGLLLRDVPTLREALEVVVRHVRIHNEAMSLVVERAKGQVTIRIAVSGAGNEPVAQLTELVLGVTFRFLQVFLGASWRPQLVCFSHGRPARASAHRQFFGCTVSFGEEFNGIVCDEDALNAPNPGADPVMTRYIGQVLQQPAAHDLAWETRVRQCVALLLPRGYCRTEIVAQHLGVGTRTLTRRLAEEGWRFTAVVDAVRDELVARYLADGSKPLGEIAYLLGFSMPSAFSRWHRQRHGKPARQAMQSRRRERLRQ